MTKSFQYSLGAEGLRSPLSVLFRVEPTVAYTLRRCCDFNQMILFLDDFPVPTKVIVSKGDTIMPSDSVIAHGQDHAAQAKLLATKSSAPPLASVSFFPADKFTGGYHEHGTWCHDAPMNEIVFREIMSVSTPLPTASEKDSNARSWPGSWLLSG
mmetsp:Transcript_22311/g.50448  ORF Transcript_22311/g.50448 Transcript_22311/m.50448 type:complete len:155 (+) Transcript_22311:3-467(+)